mmetsp:Transcript_16679/g.58326  ORF Transcript_16679/g.58326 Transcript_16679/m.58326 type:complete len:214 (-) Transcript_16679:718-1359(-)
MPGRGGRGPCCHVDRSHRCRSESSGHCRHGSGRHEGRLWRAAARNVVPKAVPLVRTRRIRREHRVEHEARDPARARAGARRWQHPRCGRGHTHCNAQWQCPPCSQEGGRGLQGHGRCNAARSSQARRSSGGGLWRHPACCRGTCRPGGCWRGRCHAGSSKRGGCDGLGRDGTCALASWRRPACQGRHRHHRCAAGPASDWPRRAPVVGDTLRS